MDRIQLPMEWKATDEPGVLEGWASTFGNIDLGDDRIEAGAFKATLADDIKAAGIPLLADHMATTSSVLGTIFDGREGKQGAKDGLWIKARFSSAPSAQDVYIKAREGHLRSMSIGYSPSKFRYEEVDGRQVRVLEEIKLWETSVVVFPMNPQATIERVKSLAGELPEAARKEIAEELIGHTTDGTPIVLVGDDDEDTAAAEPADGEEQDSAPTSGDGAEAAHAEATQDDPAPAETSGWDRWASEAVLAGADPAAKATTAQRAGAAERLRLMEEAMASRKTETDGMEFDPDAAVRNFRNAERNR